MMCSRLIQLRHTLHRIAELSGQEEKTAATISEYLKGTGCTTIVNHLGGHGIAAVYDSGQEGQEILIRSDLDALPIQDTPDLDYTSITEGVAHKCGHDGHMAILAGIAEHLKNNPVKHGKVILLFQPAEENGQGAAQVLADPVFAQFTPDMVFALHNLPGFEKGSVIVRDGTFACASKGVIIDLTGATSHAAQPEQGKSPALAVAELIHGLSALPQTTVALHEAVKVTVIYAKLGEIAFGTSPGKAQVMATLRAHDGNVLAKTGKHAERLAHSIAHMHELEVEINWTEEFPETFNDIHAASLVKNAARSLDLDVIEPPVPFPWSEDFGHFTHAYPGALFGLGAGKDQPALHHPTYDFPDELIQYGVDMWLEILRQAKII